MPTSTVLCAAPQLLTMSSESRTELTKRSMHQRMLCDALLDHRHSGMTIKTAMEQLAPTPLRLDDVWTLAKDNLVYLFRDVMGTPKTKQLSERDI